MHTFDDVHAINAIILALLARTSTAPETLLTGICLFTFFISIIID